MEVPEIEKEVKRLLRMDNEAVDVRHEVIDEEKKLKDESGQPTVASIKEELGKTGVGDGIQRPSSYTPTAEQPRLVTRNTNCVSICHSMTNMQVVHVIYAYSNDFLERTIVRLCT